MNYTDLRAFGLYVFECAAIVSGYIVGWKCWKYGLRYAFDHKLSFSNNWFLVNRKSFLMYLSAILLVFLTSLFIIPYVAIGLFQTDASDTITAILIILGILEVLLWDFLFLCALGWCSAALFSFLKLSAFVYVFANLFDIKFNND